MKTIIISVVVLGVILGGITLSRPTQTNYVAPEVIEKKVEVKVDALDQAIKSAQEAKKTEIEAIAKKAHDEAYDQEMKKVELQVVTDFNKQLKDRQSALEKSISL